MIGTTRGLVLRQVRTVNGRRLLVLLTEDYGMITVGVTANDKGKGKTTLALRPFTHATYEIYTSRGYHYLNKGQVLDSYYGIGENVDRYMAASYALELCGKVLEEEQSVPEVYRLTVDYLAAVEKRKGRLGTLLAAYKLNLLNCLGTFPDVMGNPDSQEGQALSWQQDDSILEVLRYMLSNPIPVLSKLALKDDLEKEIERIADHYITYYLDPGELKSMMLGIGTEETTHGSNTGKD